MSLLSKTIRDACLPEQKWRQIIDTSINGSEMYKRNNLLICVSHVLSPQRNFPHKHGHERSISNFLILLNSILWLSFPQYNNPYKYWTATPQLHLHISAWQLLHHYCQGPFLLLIHVLILHSSPPSRLYMAAMLVTCSPSCSLSLNTDLKCISYSYIISFIFISTHQSFLCYKCHPLFPVSIIFFPEDKYISFTYA